MNNNTELNPALERCIGLTPFPEYVTTPGNQLYLTPLLQTLALNLAQEAEQEILQDLGLHELNAHPEYSQGYDDGLRAAARALIRLFEAT